MELFAIFNFLLEENSSVRRWHQCRSVGTTLHPCSMPLLGKFYIFPTDILDNLFFSLKKPIILTCSEPTYWLHKYFNHYKLLCKLDLDYAQGSSPKDDTEFLLMSILTPIPIWRCSGKVNMLYQCNKGRSFFCVKWVHVCLAVKPFLAQAKGKIGEFKLKHNTKNHHSPALQMSTEWWTHNEDQNTCSSHPWREEKTKTTTTKNQTPQASHRTWLLRSILPFGKPMQLPFTHRIS